MKKVAKGLAKNYKSEVPGEKLDSEDMTARQAVNQLKKISPKNKKTNVWDENAPRSDKAGTPPVIVAQIISCIIGGTFQTDVEIAAHTKVSTKTVQRIKTTIFKEFPDLLNFTEQTKSNRIEELIIEMMEETLESLKRIAQLTKNENWLEQQSAVEIATLYGAKADKVIKILSAIQSANERDPEWTSPAVEEA